MGAVDVGGDRKIVRQQMKALQAWPTELEVNQILSRTRTVTAAKRSEDVVSWIVPEFKATALQAIA